MPDEMEIAAEDVAVVDAADLLGEAAPAEPEEPVTYPAKIGRGWNTSDGYRFFDEEKAGAHQARVDGSDEGEED